MILAGILVWGCEDDDCDEKFFTLSSLLLLPPLLLLTLLFPTFNIFYNLSIITFMNLPLSPFLILITFSTHFLTISLFSMTILSFYYINLLYIYLVLVNCYNSLFIMCLYFPQIYCFSTISFYSYCLSCYYNRLFYIYFILL